MYSSWKYSRLKRRRVVWGQIHFKKRERVFYRILTGYCCAQTWLYATHTLDIYQMVTNGKWQSLTFLIGSMFYCQASPRDKGHLPTLSRPRLCPWVTTSELRAEYREWSLYAGVWVISKHWETKQSVIQHSPVGCLSMRHDSLLCDTASLHTLFAREWKWRGLVYHRWAFVNE